ncbi:glycosyltransferase [Candidatus Daviesbacteria bacterium]|nr:glycosyltransferase [Candidatus Daviesbacteria bacterium]
MPKPTTKSTRRLLLSVVIPAYRQERTITADVRRILQTLEEGLFQYDYEIIVVVDGQADKTLEHAKKVKSAKIKVIGYDKNHGKGYAVRYGMARAKGDLVAFIDAGQDISPKGIMMLLAHMEWYDADIIVGSKRHPVSQVNYPLRRKMISFLSQVLIKALFNLNVRDTQSGLKIFKRKVLEDVLPRLLVKKYAMDIEILAVAKSLGYRRIYEAPIEVHFDRATSSVGLQTIFYTLIDTLAIFYRLMILRYYSNSNKRKWIYDPDLNFRINVG